MILITRIAMLKSIQVYLDLYKTIYLHMFILYMKRLVQMRVMYVQNIVIRFCERDTFCNKNDIDICLYPLQSSVPAFCLSQEHC